MSSYITCHPPCATFQVLPHHDGFVTVSDWQLKGKLVSSECNIDSSDKVDIVITALFWKSTYVVSKPPSHLVSRTVNTSVHSH